MTQLIVSCEFSNQSHMKKFFCLPYAGSSATFYYTWKDGLQGIEIVPIELAGRGQRFV